MDINFGSSVTNCSVIFDTEGNYGIANNAMWIHGNNWNGMASFPNGTNIVRVGNSTVLNKKIDIPDSVNTMSSSFYNCRNFNQNIQIPNGVTSMAYTFSYCSNLNQNIQIPNGVTNMLNTFSYCSNLNQNIQIPNSVTTMSYTFNSCSNLNQNIQIPNGVTSMAYTFSYCSNLNQNIQIPNGVTNMLNTFSYCSNLNQNIQIPNSVTQAGFVFRNCNNIYDITINDGVANSVFTGMLPTNNTHSRNIWTGQNSAANLITTNIIHPANANVKTAAQIRPTWETITNGYYNALYNIYIYTNAVFN